MNRSTSNSINANHDKSQEMTVFSKECPALLTHHFEQLHKGSAISIDVIKERGYKSVLGKTPLKEADFSKAQQRAPGILIPLHGVDGSIVGHQYRPDKPREDTKRGRLIKYENPLGSSIRLDIPPRCLGQLGDPSVDLFFTEGAKKSDSLATQGACAVNLGSVWGFKGKNPFGGVTLQTDFDSITLKDRISYVIYDSDYATNPFVYKAQERLLEHLRRKGSNAKAIYLPPKPDGGKQGVDDFLAAGHTINDLIALALAPKEIPRPSSRYLSSEAYCIEDGRLSWVKPTQNGEVVVPLCNFDAKVTEVVTRDNGLDITKALKIIGFEGSGQPLPTVDVPTSNFESMGWITGEWDTRAIVSANQTAKSRLREAILLQSQDASRRIIFSHTGWRDIDGQPAFLTASGALGLPNVDVEVEDDLINYQLPEPVDDPKEAIRASYEFLQIGSLEVLLPLWSVMFLAPLSEILEPAFTLFVVGPSGAYKSTLTALALNHFGEKFDEFHLPAAWRDTENKLEKSLFLAKDLPLIIDDWAPGQDSAKAREMEVKAEHVIRAQGNLQGRGRLRSDTSSRKKYIPRGLLITSGEQLPGGYSHTARIFTVEVESSDIDLSKLTAAQERRYLYSIAMTHYILWLQRKLDELKKGLRKQWKLWREQARTEQTHPRLFGEVAWLYAGLTLALDFMSESGVIDPTEAAEMSKGGWKLFVKLAEEQGSRVEEQRPGKKFVAALASLMDQGKVIFWSKDDDEPRKVGPSETVIGWTEGDTYLLLNPQVAYAAVHEFCSKTGEPFTFKQSAVWKDLKRLGYSMCNAGRYQASARIYGNSRWVVKLRTAVLQGEGDLSLF
ncbi:hypothetical protein ES703_56092 [subsurface metagenome]